MASPGSQSQFASPSQAACACFSMSGSKVKADDAPRPNSPGNGGGEIAIAATQVHDRHSRLDA